MVVFVCGDCNDALKKNSVEAHFNKCNSSVISCCDCGKDFNDDSYKAHTQCMSENQKYGRQDQQAAHRVDKGQKRQQYWLNNIKEAVSKINLSGPAEMALNKLLEYPNIPRKKAKFVNFAGSCVGIYRPDVIDQIWNIFESANKATNGSKFDNSRPNEQSQEENGPTKQKDNHTHDNSQKKKKPVYSEPERLSQSIDSQNMPETGFINPTSEDGVQNKENVTDHYNGDNEEKKSKKKKKREHHDQDNNDNLDQTNRDNETRTISEFESNTNVESKSEDQEKTENKETSDQVEDHNEANSLEEIQKGWFKKLKRQIKDKKIVNAKELKKMIKKLKGEYGLNERSSDLLTKAKSKLMKRHNYIVSDEKIQYAHLF